MGRDRTSEPRATKAKRRTAMQHAASPGFESYPYTTTRKTMMTRSDQHQILDKANETAHRRTGKQYPWEVHYKHIGPVA